MIRSRLSIPVLFAILSPILSACNGNAPTSLSTSAVTDQHSSLAVSRPRPVVCPSRATETVTGTIGPAGGTLELSGGHYLVVPTGALTSPTEFTLTSTAGPLVAVVVTAQGTEPSQSPTSAALTISYGRCKRQNLAPASVRVSPINAKLNVASDVLPGDTDRQAETVTFVVDLFVDDEGLLVARSTYAVAY